ncbi:MAG: hypothetical protein EOO27_34565, partial [Comamonadaceae bacterium]
MPRWCRPGSSTRAPARDAQMNLIPALALSWKTLDDTTWEFKLRPDVKFSNGKTFTSE